MTHEHGGPPMTLRECMEAEEATPPRRPLYVFLWRRPRDSRAWPSVYEDRELAEAAPYRVSEVVEVRLVATPPA